MQARGCKRGLVMCKYHVVTTWGQPPIEIEAEAMSVENNGTLLFETGDDLVAAFRDWMSVVEVD